jgi:large subunit ribosomal protein L40
MRKAIDLLEQTDKGLWEKAVGGKKFQNVDQSETSNARLEGIVPRELRVPMEQPGGQLWDSDWKAPATAESKKA